MTDLPKEKYDAHWSLWLVRTVKTLAHNPVISSHLTFIFHPSILTSSIGWFVEAQGSWCKSQRCYLEGLGGDQLVESGLEGHVGPIGKWCSLFSGPMFDFVCSRASNPTSPHFPTDFFRHHCNLFHSFHLPQTNVPLFYKDSLTPTARFLMDQTWQNEYHALRAKPLWVHQGKQKNNSPSIQSPLIFLGGRVGLS